ncbi:MAG: helix-turn-helix domain-containing protein [Bacteroidales bacterium]|nr:helix-turn-helix domain-containing protein [Bacteroidales bacterium]
MAKERERRLAHILYVEQKKTAKEVAEMVGVSEKTLSDWVTKFNWKTERSARNTSPSQRIANLENIIAGIAEERIELTRQLAQVELTAAREEVEEIRKQISKLDDAVSKWNKTLRDINKEARIPLATYLEVMQTIFDALQAYDPKLYMQTLNFQEHHVHTVSLKMGL